MVSAYLFPPRPHPVFWHVGIQRQWGPCRPESLKNHAEVSRREIRLPQKIADEGTVLQAFSGVGSRKGQVLGEVASASAVAPSTCSKEQLKFHKLLLFEFFPRNE